MRKGCVFLLSAVCLVFAASVGFSQEDIEDSPECNYCGMDRKQFAHSRMLIEYEDDSEGTCSLHCAAIHLAIHIDTAPKGVNVGDYNTKKLIDAEKATWVIGGNKPGVMTRRAKWAFEKKGDAEKFVKENGGRISTFEEAMKAAYEDMYTDTKMIQERRKMKKMDKPEPKKK